MLLLPPKLRVVLLVVLTTLPEASDMASESWEADSLWLAARTMSAAFWWWPDEEPAACVGACCAVAACSRTKFALV